MGSYQPLTITYKAFTITPACGATTATYTINLANGSPLPSYILADVVSNTITVVDDGTLKVGSVDIAVTGSVNSLSATLNLKLKILPSLSSQDLSKTGFQLPHVALTVYGN